MRVEDKVNLMIEDLKGKLHLFCNYLTWKALKQIECFCQVNEVEVPKTVEFSIKVHELAAKRDGAILENWDDGMDLVTWRKAANFSDGNCMFFEQDRFLRKKFEARKQVRKNESDYQLSMKLF